MSVTWPVSASLPASTRSRLCYFYNLRSLMQSLWSCRHWSPTAATHWTCRCSSDCFYCKPGFPSYDCSCATLGLGSLAIFQYSKRESRCVCGGKFIFLRSMLQTNPPVWMSFAGSKPFPLIERFFLARGQHRCCSSLELFNFRFDLVTQNKGSACCTSCLFYRLCRRTSCLHPTTSDLAFWHSPFSLTAINFNSSII